MGLVVADEFFISPAVWGAVLVAGVMFLAFPYRSIRGVAVIGIMCSLAVVRWQFAQPVIDAKHIAWYTDSEFIGRGVVRAEPEPRDDTVRYVLGDLVRERGSEEMVVAGRILVMTSPYPSFTYGDEVRITCALESPQPFNGFRYDRYLQRKDIYALCRRPSLSLIATGRGNVIYASIVRMKEYFRRSLEQALPEPHAALAVGMLLGGDAGLPRDAREWFTRTGTAHIIAVSGFNVAIVVGVLTATLIGIGMRRQRTYLAIIVGVILFVMLTGAQASVVRAGIFGSIALLARWLGRKQDARVALALTATVMAAINPFIVRYDVGFQLSFLATMGITWLQPIFVDVLRLNKWQVPLKRLMKEYVLTTIAAIIATQPLIMYAFGGVSYIAPIANILIVPVIPAAMGLSFVTAVMGLVAPALGVGVGWFSWLVVHYIIGTLSYLSHIPWAYTSEHRIGFETMSIAYLCIWCSAWLYARHARTRL